MFGKVESSGNQQEFVFISCHTVSLSLESCLPLNPLNTGPRAPSCHTSDRSGMMPTALPGGPEHLLSPHYTLEREDVEIEASWGVFPAVAFGVEQLELLTEPEAGGRHLCLHRAV